MPKFANERIDQRQQVNADDGQAQITKVVASPVNTYVHPAESNLTRLAASLNSFVPYSTYLGSKMAEETFAEEEAKGFKAAKTGEAASPTANAIFQTGYAKANWDTQAINASNEALKEYQTKRDDPNFDLDKFLQEKMQGDLKGVNDPIAIKAYTEKFMPAATALKRDFAQHQTNLVMEQRRADLSVGLSDLVGQLVDPNHPEKMNNTAEFMPKFQAMSEKFKAMSITKPEIAEALLHTINAKSKEMKGSTALYDIFYEKDPATGRSMVEMNPKLAEAVEKAKYSANVMYNTNMTKELFTQNQSIMMDVMQRLRNNPESLTDDYLNSLRAPHMPFGMYGGYSGSLMSIIAQRDQQVALKNDAIATQGDIAAGNGWKYSDDIVRKNLTATLSPDIQTLTQSLNNPNAFTADKEGKPASAASVALQNIVTAMTRTGTNVVPKELENVANSVKLMAPDLKDKDAKVPPRFTNLYNLYSALSSSSNAGLVNQVFDKESRQIMESYDYLRKHGQLEETSAWRKAFFYSSEEGLEYMKKRVNSPEGQKKIEDAVRGSVSGLGSTDTTRLPNWMRVENHDMFGLYKWAEGSYPKNYDSATVPAMQEARRILMTHEGISDSELQDKLKGWFRSNYIHDETTNRVVKVQEGTASRNLVEAFSSFSQDIRNDPAYGKDVDVSYVYRGNGQYSVEISDANGKMLRREYPDISQQQILDQFKYKKTFTPDESKVIGTLDSKARDGKLTVEDITANRQIIDKARQTNLMSDPLKKSIDGLNTTAKDNVNVLYEQIKKAGITNASPINANSSRIPDMAAKTPVVKMLMAQGDHAGALTAMGEGVALKAYKDPANGTDIGIGYNIDQNRKTVEEDFRKAGIQYSVADIESGKASISVEQAVRLYQVVKPRYEAMATNAFEAKYGKGSFNNLSAPEKAVLTDIAYQSGASVKNFNILMDRMFNKNYDGNLEGDLSISYKNRNGDRVVDKNRNNLRLNMLLGKWGPAVKLAGIN